MVTWLELLAYKVTRPKMLPHSNVIKLYNKRLGDTDMTSEWKDHVAHCARGEIAAEKETVPYGYDDLRDEHTTMFKQDIDADLKKYWHATQGGE